MSEATRGLPVGEIAPAHRFDIAALDRYLHTRIEDFVGDWGQDYLSRQSSCGTGTGGVVAARPAQMQTGRAIDT